MEFLEILRRFDIKVDLFITSPPYNLGKEYETSRSLEEYVSWQQEVISACVERLKPAGGLCWQVGHYIEGTSRQKEAFPLDLVLYPVFKSLGLKLRNRVVWHFGHGLHDRIRFSGRHETILWFTKSDEYTFNLDAVRVPQKYPGKKYFKGPNQGSLSGNPKGKNPSDVWDIPNVKSNHREKLGHPCQFPVGLAERLILALTNPDDLVVDPFVGVGTTAVAADRHARHFMGSDLESSYIDIAWERINLLRQGKLPIRPMNMPVYAPK